MFDFSSGCVVGNCSGTCAISRVLFCEFQVIALLMPSQVCALGSETIGSMMSLIR